MMDNKKLIGELIFECAKADVLKKAVLSKPLISAVQKSVLSQKLIAGKKMLQCESFMKDNKALHKNLALDDADALCELIDAYAQINVITTLGDTEYRESKSGKSTLIGYSKLLGALEGASDADKVKIEKNNREKNYILSGNEDFLKLLGVSDKNGRVYDKKRAKFRQINRFLELVSDVVYALPDGELRICDLCCGKSYLSFAVYHYFANVLGRKVKMTGVDLKSDVIEYCSDVAKKLSFDGLEFLCGDISKYDTGEHVNLVVSLHACDTATDLVLEKAIQWSADVILSTPCCHHELNHTLNCPELEFIAAHSMLRQKLCDVATDALRLKLLESRGYSVCALELIDPEETPKNIMLRAVRQKGFDADGKKAQILREEYRCAYDFLVRGKLDV